MFEFSVACKYLIPRWRQLSVSIISLVSIFVISLVVWLILVFFSITNGLEKNWVEKLIALMAPVRIVPTEAYYNSYYYQIDSISEASGYTYKTLREKSVAMQTDPYDPEYDEEQPLNWAMPDTDESGRVKDLVKLAEQAVHSVHLVKPETSFFETAIGNLHLNLQRADGVTQLNQSTYLGSFDPKNRELAKTLIVDTASKKSRNAQAVSIKEGEMAMPSIPGVESILLPKSFRDDGVLVGDRGTISYKAPTTSSVQEQQVPVYVVGFYDQGVTPIGGRFVWGRPELIAMVSTGYDMSAGPAATGINVRFDQYEQAGDVKREIVQNLKTLGIADYWNVETYREYPFTKELLEQQSSQRNLFTIISIVIILVACSNIVSLLVILVNDKKTEIGVLRSMGATSTSIAAIFGFCGLIMGLLGSLMGIAFAVATLRHIDFLINAISYLQGHELFNAHFYGDVIPNELSSEALTFVLIATVLTSLVSGVVPALKASLMKPADILRADG